MDPSAPAPAPTEELAEGVTFKDAKERWVASFERDYILRCSRRNTGNISHAAREADIDRKYFRKLMKKYDIEAAGADDDPESTEPDADDADADADAGPRRRGPPPIPSTCSRCLPAPIPRIDWGLTSHLHADGSPRIIERAWWSRPSSRACASITS